MRHLTYLAVLAACLAGALWLEPILRVNVLRRWRRLLLTVLPVAVVFALWDVTDPRQPTRIGVPATDHTGSVYTVAFSPTTSTVVSGGQDGSVMLWDVSGPAGPRWIRPSLTGDGAPVYAVALSPDGRSLAGAGAGGSVLRWEVPADGPLRSVGTPLTGDDRQEQRFLAGQPWFRVALSHEPATAGR